MKKNKNSLEKDKKRKVPLNVLSKKGLMGLALAGVMIASPFMLAGCSNGQDGKDGKDGANGPQWHYSTIDVVDGTLSGNVDFTAVNGDFYIDTDSYILYQLKNNSWSVVMENYGKPGTPGVPGEPGISSYTHIKYSATMPDSNDDMLDTANDYIGIYVGTSATAPTDYTAYTWYKIKGEKGEDGTSVYVGYDGYVWNGETRTNLSFTTLAANVAENTLELKDNQYFKVSTISAGTKIALMANHFEYIKATQYSGTTITELTTYVSKDGKLDIGVVNLSTGAYTLKTTEDVEEGSNTLSLDIEVGENETLVLGGDNTTVELYKSSGVTADDEYGLFSTDMTNFNLSQTNEVNDKLIVNVKVSLDITYSEEQSILPDIQTLASNGTFSDSSTYGTVSDRTSAFVYANESLFENRTISKIGIPIKTINSGTDNAITLYRINSSQKTNIASNYIEKYTVDIQNPTANMWCYGDCNIEVGEGETLAIQYSATSFDSVYKLEESGNNSDYAFVIGSNGNQGNAYLLMDAYYYENATGATSFKEHLTELFDKNQQMLEANLMTQRIQTLSNIILNKNFSILGDSISTFTGVSNDAENTNSTIGSNAVFYSTQIEITDTWWKQAIDMTGMNMLVNNSYSGDTVANAKISRCMNLHDNTGDNSGTNPDIIAVYIGVNDIKNTSIVSVETFKINYLTMIENMISTYGNSDIFLFTIPQYTMSGAQMWSDEELDTYNDAIREIAQEKGCVVVDLFADSGISQANHTSLTIEGLHPTAEGMDLITNCFLNVLYETYVTNAE